MRPGRQTALLLATCQAFYLSASSIGTTASGLVGLTLAPTPVLATLPYSLIPLTNAAVTVPASFLMARLGRRAGFFLGAALGGLGGAIGATAIFERNFLLFCLGNALWGCFQATAQYYRFAAADAVEPAYKPRAVSWVLAGGVLASVMGPEIATYAQSFVASVQYAGSYFAISVLSALTILTLSFLRIPGGSTAARSWTGGRPFREIARQPIFAAAVVNGVVGYSIMSFIMTASPLAAVFCGHSSTDAIGIIRWHLVGMFLPAFFTGVLVSRYGAPLVALCGTAMLVACGIIANAGTSLVHFWVALALLGVGWNFMFISGTTLLTQAYRPEESAKVQGLNEFLIAGSAALGSLTSGGAFNLLGWDAMNLGVMPLLILAAAITVWYALSERRLAAGNAPSAG
ncbi:MAG TPA: MFS transporter [Stellaceae bacterium]|nr:MFS transporter [Stellaceae bacterium]